MPTGFDLPGNRDRVILRCMETTRANTVRALGDGLFGPIHPDDMAEVEATRTRCIETGAPYVVEYRLVGRSGGSTWVQETVAPTTGEDEGLFTWTGVLEDIGERTSIEHRLQGSEERLRLCVKAIGLGIWQIDFRRDAWTWTAEVDEAFGMPADTPRTAAGFLRCVHPNDRVRVEGFVGDKTEATADCSEIVFRIIRKDTGQQRWMTSTSVIVKDLEGQPGRRCGTVQDITAQKVAELERQASEHRLQEALRIGKMVLWDRDVASGIVVRSANADELLGNRKEHIAEFFDRVHPDDRDLAVWDGSVRTIPSGIVQFRYRHPNGSELWLETSAIILSADKGRGHVVGLTTDITDKKVAEAKLLRAASHDPLTGLLSRAAFTRSLDDAVAQAALRGEKVYLLLLDVDFFKTINDSLGHDAGDRVLKAIGERLAAMTPPIAFAARLGGDEFAAVLSGNQAIGDITRMSRHLSEQISTALPLEDRSLVVDTSIGIACCPDHGNSSSDLLKNADLALYAAKQAGRRQTTVFAPKMRAALDARALLEAEFRDALANGRIIPYYQPKLDLVTGTIVGFEALARWAHPERGLLTPTVFSPVFENGPIVIHVGKVMRGAVLRDIKTWLTQGLAIGRIAVNCASHEFRAGDLARTILRELGDAAVSPANFEIEVTEGVMVGRDADAVGRTLEALHRGGIKISLDDFGTGYASLIHLKQFPVDEIKLDRSFVAEMDKDPNPAIIRAILAMGGSLGLTTVAEGVETFAQAAALYEMGCTQAQGFLFGKPMSASRVPWFVTTGVKRFATAPRGDRAAS